MKKLTKPYQSGAAKAFINDRLALGVVSFPLNEFVEKTHLSCIAARNQLLRLGAEIVRVSPLQSYFLIVTPEHRSFGAPPVEWWLNDYMQWLERPYYLALQSAATAFGSSHQAIQETQVITNIPRRSLIIGRTRIHFFMKTHIERTITQPLSGTHAPLTVSTPESTAFDLVRYAIKLGGIERMAETIIPMLPLLKVKRLHRVLVTENEIATAQRLGFIFDSIGAGSLAMVVRTWLPAKLKKITLSSHASTPEEDNKNVPVNSVWSVINNTQCFR